jgi:AbrB family looped-hinge helix DNA binding protein
MPTATVTSKGQITIPKPIREFLHLKAGDVLDFVIDERKQVVVRPGTVDIRELKGMLYRPGRRPVTLEEMDAAILRRRDKRR